jgi:ADP-ribose pyrophosphatase YjhB (NUDIX family)
VQVPAGTVKQGEPLETALIREIEEGTGLSRERVALVRKLGTYEYVRQDIAERQERHVYHLVAEGELPDHWEWLETGGGEMPDAEGHLFQFRWTPVSPLPILAGDQGHFLPSLIKES